MLIFQFQKNSQTTFPNVDIKWIFIFFLILRGSPPLLPSNILAQSLIPCQDDFYFFLKHIYYIGCNRISIIWSLCEDFHLGPQSGIVHVGMGKDRPTSHPHEFAQPHIRERCLPPLPYKPLA